MVETLIRPLRTEADYEAALAEIERYFEQEPGQGTPEADRFDLLALVIQDYERKHWPIEPPDDVEAIRFSMETRGHTQAELGKILGSRQRASDVLTGKRPLTMGMAWRLNREWEIPAEALINSSAIRDANYDLGRRELTVTFVTGRRYLYFDVEPETYEAFTSASSKGGFFNTKIRDRYAFEEIAITDGTANEP